MVQRVVGQHLTYLLFGESHHLVESVGKGVVGTDIEAAGEVVEGHRTHACHEDALYGRIGTGFDRVEEGT